MYLVTLFLCFTYTVVYIITTCCVLNVLQIIPLPGYYTVDHIYPVGFCSTRLYLSISGTCQMCLYTCKVSDSGTAAKVIVTSICYCLCHRGYVFVLVCLSIYDQN